MLILMLACVANEPGDTDPTDTEAHTDALVDTESDLDFGQGYPDDFLTGYAVDLDNEPVAGVVVCLVDSQGSWCDESGTDGQYTVGPVHENEEATFTLQAEGYVPTLIPWRSHGFMGAGLMNFRFHLWPDAAPWSVTEGGNVIVTANGGKDDNHFVNVEGVVLAMDGAQPTYLDLGGEPDETLEATTQRGQALFTGVSAGTHTAAAQATNPCVPWYGWGETASEATLPVEDGWLTQASLSCP